MVQAKAKAKWKRPSVKPNGRALFVSYLRPEVKNRLKAEAALAGVTMEARLEAILCAHLKLDPRTFRPMAG